MTATNSIFYGLNSLFSLNFDDVDLFRSRSVDVDSVVSSDRALSATSEDYPVVEEFKEPSESLSSQVEAAVAEEMLVNAPGGKPSQEPKPKESEEKKEAA